MLMVLSLGMCFFVFRVHAAENIDALFKEADEIKVSQPEKLQQLLDQLSALNSSLAVSQIEFHDYLSTFILLNEGEYEKAAERLESIQNQTKDLTVKVRSLLTLSNIYAFTKQYERAFSSLNYVTENLNEISDRHLKNVIYLAMSNTYLLTNQYKLSKKFAGFLLDHNVEDGIACRARIYEMAATLNSEPINWIEEQQINELHDYCVEAKQIVQAKYIMLVWYRALIKNEAQPISEAKWSVINRNLEKLLAEIQGTNLKSLELITQSLLAKTSIYFNQKEAAQNFAEAVLESKEVIGDHQPKLDALNILKNIAEEQGDFQLAYRYLSELDSINNELIKDNQLKELAFLNVKHANTARELEIEQLNKSNEILKIEQQLAKQKVFNQQLLVLLLLIVLGFTTAWLYRIRKRHGVLEKAADLDHLTKIYNRSGFEKWIERWIERAEKNQLELHFAILDFDHFKQINDQYGHLAGDWVLKHVVYEIKKHLDEHMMIGRLGGEEFCLAIIDKPMEEAEEKMEVLRKVVENLDLTGSGFDISITCSFGVTSHYVSGYNLVSLLTHADVALYQAKSAGRNRLIRYQP